MFMGNPVVVSWLPNWGIFYQPLGALIFFAATFAETNRLPFDLPEAEANWSPDSIQSTADSRC